MSVAGDFCFMPIFIVSFDLDRIGSNYSAIRKRLVGLNALQAQGSVWFIKHEGSADELRELLQECLDQNDRLFVAMINGNWSGYNIGAPGRWLKEQVPASCD
jgi:hypothetical protein